MKQKGQKRLKNGGYVNEDTKEIKTLIIITIAVVLLAIGLYFLTDVVLDKKDDSSFDTEFNYDTCLVGNIFNRPYDEYYVFIYSSIDDDASTYDTLKTSYLKKDEAKKIYYVDLNNGFNSFVVSDTSNTKPKSASDVRVNKSALILIKDGKVSKYYETLDDYKKVLN